MKTILTTIATVLFLTTSASAMSFTEDEKIVVLNSASAAGALGLCSARYEMNLKETDVRPYFDAGNALYQFLSQWLADATDPDVQKLAATGLVALKNGYNGSYTTVRGEEFNVTEVTSPAVCDLVKDDAIKYLADLKLIDPNN